MYIVWTSCHTSLYICVYCACSLFTRMVLTHLECTIPLCEHVFTQHALFNSFCLPIHIFMLISVCVYVCTLHIRTDFTHPRTHKLCEHFYVYTMSCRFPTCIIFTQHAHMLHALLMHIRICAPSVHACVHIHCMVHPCIATHELIHNAHNAYDINREHI